jgi:molecular chaperone GrpE (heat shock protein)
MEIEKVLKRHGVVPFDPTGEQFDPNRHEALYQAPVPGKEPGSVIECQEIGCTFFLNPSMRFVVFFSVSSVSTTGD